MKDIYFSDYIFAADGEYDEAIKNAVQSGSEREENIALKQMIRDIVEKSDGNRL